MAKHRATVVPLLLAAVLAAPLYGAARVLLSTSTAESERFDVRYVPVGRALRFLSPAVRLSIADAYWLATVQYVGDQTFAQGRFEELFPLADLITDLDPDHGYAYQTAGIVLSAVGRVDESNRILQKGIERGPNWWSYPFYVAFNHFFYLGDYATASQWAERAARTPGASSNISHLALSLRVRSGHADDAVRFLEELRRHAPDDRAASALDEQYRLAVLQRDFAALDAAVAAYREARGRPPSDLEDLVRAGMLAGIPSEPFGGRYFVREDGSVHSSGRDFRFRPPERGHLRPGPVR